MLKKYIIIFFLVSSCFNLINSSVYASFGISPADLTYMHLLPGMQFEKDYLLSRTDLGEDAKVVVEVDVEGANDWIEIDPGISFTIPKGQQTEKIKVIVNVPEDVALKNYEGYITVKVTENKKTSGVSVVGGVGISVNLTTTDLEVKSLLVRKMEIPDVSQTKPLRLLLTIENQGNKEVAPEKIVFVINNIAGEKVLESEKTDLGKIKPGKIGELSIDLANDLGKGDYSADVEVVFEGENIGKDKLFFSINEEVENVEDKVDINPVRVNNIPLLLGIFILVLLLIIALRKFLKDKIF